MPERQLSSVAIVDYGMGNLFSVQMACEKTGLAAAITSEARDILVADAVILPGVGAFGDAMAALRRLDLVAVLKDAAAHGKPLLGICLGLQLLMWESSEFGRHQGLGLVPGTVVRFPDPQQQGRKLKVPQVGWNQLRYPARNPPRRQQAWQDSYLRGLAEGDFMYFVHSFIAQPQDPEQVLSTSRYGDVEFCSSLRAGNIFGCQFHPERSGPQGLRIYQNLAAQLQRGAPNPDA